MRRPSPSFIISCLALVIALSGTSYAAIQIPRNSVGTAQLKNGAVTNAKVKDRSLLARDFAPGQVPAARPGPWKPLPFASGWANYEEDQVRAAYRKDQLGRVTLRGFVTSVNFSPYFSAPIAYLPPGFRPRVTANMHFPAVTGTGGEPTATAGAVYVTPSGEVGWMAGATASKDYTDLSSVSFWTD